MLGSALAWALLACCAGLAGAQYTVVFSSTRSFANISLPHDANGGSRGVQVSVVVPANVSASSGLVMSLRISGTVQVQTGSLSGAQQSLQIGVPISANSFDGEVSLSSPVRAGTLDMTVEAPFFRLGAADLGYSNVFSVSAGGTYSVSVTATMTMQVASSPCSQLACHACVAEASCTWCLQGKSDAIIPEASCWPTTLLNSTYYCSVESNSIQVCPPASHEHSGKRDDDKTALIISLSIGGVVVVGVFGALMFVLMRRHKRTAYKPVL